jgi:hypothetical protein
MTDPTRGACGTNVHVIVRRRCPLAPLTIKEPKP